MIEGGDQDLIRREGWAGGECAAHGGQDVVALEFDVEYFSGGVFVKRKDFCQCRHGGAIPEPERAHLSAGHFVKTAGSRQRNALRREVGRQSVPLVVNQEHLAVPADAGVRFEPVGMGKRQLKSRKAVLERASFRQNGAPVAEYEGKRHVGFP